MTCSMFVSRAVASDTKSKLFDAPDKFSVESLQLLLLKTHRHRHQHSQISRQTDTVHTRNT